MLCGFGGNHEDIHMGRGLTSLNLQMSIFDKFDLNILRYFPLVGEYQRSGSRKNDSRLDAKVPLLDSR